MVFPLIALTQAPTRKANGEAPPVFSKRNETIFKYDFTRLAGNCQAEVAGKPEFSCLKQGYIDEMRTPHGRRPGTAKPVIRPSGSLRSTKTGSEVSAMLTFPAESRTESRMN